MSNPSGQESRTEPDAPPPTARPAAPAVGSGRSAVIAGVVFWVVIGVLVVGFSETVRTFLWRNIFAVAGVAVVIVVAIVVGIAMSGDRTEAAKRRSGVIIFFVLPTLLGLVVASALVPEQFQVPILRSVFLVAVTMLPATLYYLFIFSRKSSLLQEYLANLARLGLLRRSTRRRGGEGEEERSRRVRGYVHRFEAIYGEIPDAARERVVRSTDRELVEAPGQGIGGDSAPGALGAVFTLATLIPVAVATVLIGLGWILVLPPWEGGASGASLADRLKDVLRPGDTPILYAFLGAYFFSIQMLFRRYVRRDLHANAYVAVSLRIILAVVGTWAVLVAASILPWEQGRVALPVLAFVIGAFPPIAWEVVRAALRKVTGAELLVPSLSSAMPVSELDGLTVWHEARLEEEDIENVPNMATADIVELMLDTRYPPGRIIDWVDQAILYTQLGKEKDPDASTRQQLGAHGIRTASALIAAYEESVSRHDVDAFESILPGDGRKRLRSLADTVTTHPNLELVMEWRGLDLPAHVGLPAVERAAGAGVARPAEPPLPPVRPPAREQAVPPHS